MHKRREWPRLSLYSMQTGLLMHYSTASKNIVAMFTIPTTDQTTDEG